MHVQYNISYQSSVRPDVLNELLKYPEVFFIREIPNLGDCLEVMQCFSWQWWLIVFRIWLQTIVELNPAFRDYAERTEKVDLILRDMRNRGLFPAALKGSYWFYLLYSYLLRMCVFLSIKNLCILLLNPAEHIFSLFLGWRDENYEVMTVTNVSMMKMDRSATCLFGIRNFGVEINGYIRHPQKGLCIWLQQRSSMYYMLCFFLV